MNHRICKKCQQSTPIEKLWNRRGFICAQCATKHPSFKYRAYRCRAKISNINFQLTKEDFLPLWQKPCTYCGDAIETIGLDRIDSNQGYILDNITPCCSVCNTIKSIDTVDDFKKRIQRIVTKHVR